MGLRLSVVIDSMLNQSFDSLLTDTFCSTPSEIFYEVLLQIEIDDHSLMSLVRFQIDPTSDNGVV